ncbi:1645_t:CDS:2 [Gigaspora rosea]|nr:1645_t:CDS:2 [Gigaspora rosea]
MVTPWVSLTNEASDIKRSFVSADEEIKTIQITLQNSQNSKYVSKLINTKEISAKFSDSKMYDLIVYKEAD